MRSPEEYVKELRQEMGGEHSSAFFVVLFDDGQYDIVRSDDSDPFELLNGMVILGGQPVILGRITDNDGFWGLRFRILPEYADNDFVKALSKAMVDAAKQMSRQNLDNALKSIARASDLPDET
jgi:hypothetical protein